MRLFRKIRRWKAHRDWKREGVYVLDLRISSEENKLRTQFSKTERTYIQIMTAASFLADPYPTLTIHAGLRKHLDETLEHEMIHYVLDKMFGWKNSAQLDNLFLTTDDWRRVFHA